LIQQFPRGNFALNLLERLSALITALPQLEDRDTTAARIEFK